VIGPECNVGEWENGGVGMAGTVVVSGGDMEAGGMGDVVVGKVGGESGGVVHGWLDGGEEEEMRFRSRFISAM
jgi:hypothetical protein